MKRNITNKAVCLFISILAVSIILFPTAASSLTKSLDVIYQNIKIAVDGNQIETKDANGNSVEPFLLNGSVYVPIRVVSESLGMDVEWDNSTSTVHISKPSGNDILTTEQQYIFNAPTDPSKNVEVSTVEELIAAIAPDTCIILNEGLYDLSTAVGIKNEYTYWQADSYGREEKTLVIRNVAGLTLKAATNADVEIVTPWRFAEVLSFSDCNGINLIGIKAGHSVIGDYECDAGVVYFRNSYNIKIDKCFFYGCGSIGIGMNYCAFAEIKNTTVTDCSLYGIYLLESYDINFDSCSFTDNRAYMNVISGNNSIAVFSNCEISGNKQLLNSVVDTDGEFLFDGCIFINNSLVSGDNAQVISGNVKVKNCVINKEGFSDYLTEITDLGGNLTEVNFLGSDGDTHYFWCFKDENCVLYAFNRNERLKQLAVFPPIENGEYEPTIEFITDFGICGDWLILSAGHYEGSGGFFYGDFVRLKKDGSDLEHFWLTEDDSFVIADGWIYYNFWTAQDKPENLTGCYRIRPDGTDKEYMGDKIYSVIQYAEDGYIYGEYDTGEKILYLDTDTGNTVKDLIRCTPDGKNTVTLFSARTLPNFNNSQFMKYYDVEVKGNSVTFSVLINGYSEDDSWRGHIMYSADYQVNSDGTGLTLLNEEYFE